MASGEVVRAVWVLAEERLGRIMVNLLSEAGVRAEAREGFAIPAVIFALVVMSMLAMVSLVTARDEQLSSRAMHESAGAFYAAEAGYNQLLATWNDSLANTLQPGDSLDLGWQSLEGGARYRGVISRYDNGGQKMFALTVEGRGAGPAGGQRVVSVGLTKGTPITITAAGRGGVGGADIRLDSANLGGVAMSGQDMIPAQWNSGECTDPLQDIPGVEWADTNNVEIDNGAIVNGTPPLAEDTTIDATNLFDWGGMNYDDLAAMADITFPDGTDITGGLGPEVVGGVCDTSEPLNWGAPENPSNECFNYFPVIHVTGDLDIDNPGAPSQGILLVDGDLRIEQNFTFYGIIIVKGEARLEDAVEIYGGLIVGDRLRVEDGAGVQYSQCAVNRALDLSALQVSTALLGSRSWGELLR